MPWAARAPASGSASTPAAKSTDFRKSFRRLLGELRPERGCILIVLALGVVSVVLAVIGPKLLGEATNIIFAGYVGQQMGDLGLSGMSTDQVVALLQAQGQTNVADMVATTGATPGVGIDFTALARVLALVAVAYILSALFAWAQARIMAGVTQRVVYGLRRRMDEKIGRLPLATFDRQSRGDLLSRVTNDIDNISQTLQQTLTTMITSILTVIGVLVMMLSISPLLAFISLLVVPASVVVTMLIASRSQKQFAAQWERTGTLNGHIEEMHTGHAIVKLFGRQEEAVAEFDRRNEELYEASARAQFLSGIIQPAITFISNLNYVAICVIGGIGVATGHLARRRPGLHPVLAAVHLPHHPAGLDRQHPAERRGLRGARLRAARRAGGDGRPGHAGEPRAAGRRPRQPRGRGLPLRAGHAAHRGALDCPWSPARPSPSWAPPAPARRRWSTCSCASTTWTAGASAWTASRRGSWRVTTCGAPSAWSSRTPGSSRAPSARTSPTASAREVSEAAFHAAVEAAHVDHFVRTLPDGYDTVLDEDATSVSAGEKQLLTIARAFLADPPILILDEATSSVDTRTEVLIRRAMSRLMEGRTAFVIAHRLSTIRDADHILVMDHGRIIERGTHDELLAARGFYHDLYASQFEEAFEPAA